jgi:putative acetyltransferase
MVVKFIQREEKKEVSNFFYSVFSQSDGDEEGKVLKKLTSELTNQISNDLIIGLKIVSNNEMVGSIFLTKLDYRENIKIYLIAPVGVHPNHQNKKIGTKIINFASEYLRSKNISYLVTYGDPKYYSRFDFMTIKEDKLPAPFILSQPQGWQLKKLDDSDIPKITNKPKCVPPFNNQYLW